MDVFDDQISGALTTAFTAFGKTATWTGVTGPVLVIFPPETNGDGLFQPGRTRVNARQTVIHVRVSEVATPARDNLVTLADGTVYRLLAGPERIKGGHVWQCQADEVAP